jgi:hypothetical protein
MNYIRAQKEIFSSLVSGGRVCGYWQDAESYLVTGDGFHGFIFPAATIAFDTAKCNEIKRLFEVPEIMVDEHQIFETNDFRLFHRVMARRFTQGSRSIFINSAFLKNFQNAKFYQREMNKAVLVTERVGDKEIPVGVVLPLRTSEEED